MLLTVLIADSKSLKLAGLAKEVFLLRTLHEFHLLLTVDKTSKVGLETTAAFVEGTSVKRIVELAIEVEVTLCRQSFFFIQAESTRLIQSFLLNILL